MPRCGMGLLSCMAQGGEGGEKRVGDCAMHVNYERRSGRLCSKQGTEMKRFECKCTLAIKGGVLTE